jgi:cephalosporin hydroxylase
MLRYFQNKNKVRFNSETIYRGQFNIKYRGVPAWKCPFDYVIYQMIMEEVNPDLIVEIGTNYGGSALYFADLCELMGNGIVHTIDVVDKVTDLKVKNNNRIKRFLNGWKGYDVELLSSYKKILIIDDGSHEYEDVLGALEKLSKYVSVGSYYIVEDGIIDELASLKVLDAKKYCGGPIKAISKFLSQNKNFEIDKKWCNFFGQNATFNVNGYLKRIK